MIDETVNTQQHVAQQHVAQQEVAEEIAAPVEQHVAQQQEAVEQQAQAGAVQETPQQEEQSYQARNFRELREKNERIQRERDEALRRLQELERAKEAAQPKEPEYSLNPDDLVEGKHLNKYDKKMKELEKQLKSYQQQSQEVAVENKVKGKYPDFDKVVNKDTIAMLRETHPEIAETIVANTNLYSQAVSAYTMIKNLNIYKEDTIQREKAIIQENFAKPRSVASVSPQQGNTPLSRANAFAEGLTDGLKDQLRKEMEQARKNY